jgi:hypothetical protein
MYDTPTPEELLAAVARFLRDDAGPALGSAAQADHSALAYQARVAANMLDMVRRQGQLAPLAEAAERSRLQALLGDAADGTDLPALNRRLTERIADGTLDLNTPGLSEHLWRCTLDKLAVDQPAYASYQRCIAETALGVPAGGPP